MERTFGAEIGGFVRRLHERNGVTFHLGTTVGASEERDVVLATGQRVAANLRFRCRRPPCRGARAAGRSGDQSQGRYRSISGDEPARHLCRRRCRALVGSADRQSDPGRHWVVAERQGQTAARNLLGQRRAFDAVPFFWSQHYDTPISYVGHAEHWDRTDVDGSVEAGDCAVAYHLGNRKLAVVTIVRDRDSLFAEREFEQTIAAAPDR